MRSLRDAFRRIRLGLICKDHDQLSAAIAEVGELLGERRELWVHRAIFEMEESILHDYLKRPTCVAGRRAAYLGPRWLGSEPKTEGPAWQGRRGDPSHWCVVYSCAEEIINDDPQGVELLQILADAFAEIFGVPLNYKHLQVMLSCYFGEFRNVPPGRPRFNKANEWIDQWLSTWGEA